MYIYTVHLFVCTYISPILYVHIYSTSVRIWALYMYVYTVHPYLYGPYICTYIYAVHPYLYGPYICMYVYAVHPYLYGPYIICTYIQYICIYMPYTVNVKIFADNKFRGRGTYMYRRDICVKIFSHSAPYAKIFMPAYYIILPIYVESFSWQ